VYRLFSTLTIIIFFLCFASTNSASGKEGKTKISNNADISYHIEPFYDVNVFRLIVTVEFRGGKSGETKIILPNEYGGQYNLQGIKFLKVLTENSSINETPKPEVKIIKHPPGAVIKLYYQVEEIRDDDIELGNHYMTILNRKYFHFLGETFFIIPEWDWYTEYNFTITWKQIPATWNLANSFGINEKIQNIREQLWKFRSSVFTGGDFRIIRKNVKEYPIYIAMRSNWKFSDDDFGNLVKEILQLQRAFWNDYDFPLFLVTVIPIEGKGNQGGTGRTNSFALFLSEDRVIDFRLKRIIAHETFHTWLGERMSFSSPEQLVYWFKEGFADYYARLTLLRANLITINEYVENYNNVLSEYFTSPVRLEKNERLITDFWSNSNIMKLPYQRGDIIAHNLNAAIYKNSGGKFNLDDMMRDLYSRSKTQSIVISNGSLSSLIRFYAGDVALSEIMRSLNSGIPLKADPNALGECYSMNIYSARKFWLFGEKYEVPEYKLINSGKSGIDKDCLWWFGVK